MPEKWPNKSMDFTPIMEPKYEITKVAKGWQIQGVNKKPVNNITFEKQSEAIAYLDRLIAMFYK